MLLVVPNRSLKIRIPDTIDNHRQVKRRSTGLLLYLERGEDLMSSTRSKVVMSYAYHTSSLRRRKPQRTRATWVMTTLNINIHFHHTTGRQLFTLSQKKMARKLAGLLKRHYHLYQNVQAPISQKAPSLQRTLRIHVESLSFTK